MTYSEEEYLLLSGIQHFEFCRRQWALIHIEQQWEENYFTVSGELIHEKAHDKDFVEKRGNVVITRGMPVFSKEMGISGECDIVELVRDDKNGVEIFGREGRYSIEPVEYKRGELKDPDIFQLTAETMCLEEMMCCNIKYGYIYYAKTRRRERIELTEEYRERVKKDFEEMHGYFSRRYTPNVRKTKACDACSLNNLCLPKMNTFKSAKSYIDNMLGEEQT